MSSNNVDNRVVNMQFNNKQFEEGIHQTLTSLEELKQSLKFNTSVNGINTVANALNAINVTNIANDVSMLTNRFSTMGIVGMTAIQNITNSALNFTRSKFFGIINQIKTGGWARAAKVAQSRFTLEGLFKGDAEKVEKAMSSAQKAVDGTAYALDSAVAAASQLAATGIDVGDDMENTLKGIAGVAAMTGDSFDSIANIFTTVAGNGRLMGMQLSQLSYHGLNAAATLATSLGKTEEEVREMVSKGQVSFEMFSKAMQDAFGEHAADANETLNGVLDNIKSALSRIGEVFSSGIVDNKELIEFLNDVRVAINAIKKQIEPLKPTFRTLVTLVSKLGRSLLTTFDASGIGVIVGNVNAGMETLNDFIKTYLDIDEVIEGEADSVEKSAEKIEDVSKAVTKVTQAEAEAAKNIWGRNDYGNGEARRKALEAAGLDYDHVQAYVNAMRDANFDLSKVAIEVEGETKEAVEATTAAVEKTGDAAEEATNKFDGIRGVLTAVFLFGAGIKMVFNGVKKVVKSAADTFKKVFSWDKLIKDITDYSHLFEQLLGYFSLSKDRSEKLANAFEGAWSAIDLFRKAIKLLITVAVNTLGPVLSVIFDIVLTIASAVGKAITSFNKWTDEHSKLTGAISKFGETLSKVIETVKIFFEKLWNLPAVQKIKESILDLCDTLADKLGGAFDKAADAVGSFFDTFNSSSEDGSMDKVLNNINGALEKMIEFCGDAESSVNNLFGFFGKKKDDVVEFVGGTENVQENIEKVDKMGKSLAKSKGPSDFVSNFIDVTNKLGFGVDKVVDWVVAKFNSLDAAKFALVGLGTTMTATGLSMSYFTYNAAEFVKALTGIPEQTAKTVKAIRETVEGFGTYLTNKSEAAVIKSWAITIGVLAISLFALCKLVDPNALWEVAGAMTMLIGVMAIVTILMMQMSKKMIFNQNFYKGMAAMAATFISLAASTLILAAALSVLASVKFTKDIIPVGIALVVLLGILVGLTYALMKSDKTLPTGAAKILLLSAAVYVIAAALKKLQGIDIETLPDKVLALSAMIGMLALIAMTAKQIRFVNVLSILGLISGIWLIEVALMNILEFGVGMDEIKANLDKFKPILWAIGILAAFMVTVGVACKKAQNVAGVVLSTAISIAIMAASMKILETLSWGGLIKGIIGISVMFVAIGTLLKVLSGTDFLKLDKVGNTLIKISVAIGIISLVALLLGQFNPALIAQGFIFVTAFLAVIGIFITMTSKFAKEGIDFKALWAIVAAIGVMGLMVSLLAFYISKDPDAIINLLAAMGIIGGLLITFGVSMALASKYADRMNNKSVIAMISTLLIIVGSLMLLSQTADWLTLLSAAGAMALVLLSIGKSMELFSKAVGSKDVGKKGNLLVMLQMIGMVGVIAGALWLLSKDFAGNELGLIAAGIVLAGTMIIVLNAIGRFLKVTQKLSVNKTVRSTIGLILGIIVTIGALLVVLMYLVNSAEDGMGGLNAIAAAGAMLMAIAGIIAVLAIFIKQMQGLKINGKILGLLGIAIGLVVACGTLIAVITALANGNNDTILYAGLALMGVMAMVLIAVGAFAIYVKDVSTRTLVAILLACAVVVAVGYALKEVLLAGVDWHAMIGAAAAMAIVLGALMVSVGILTAIVSHFGGIGLVAALIVFAGLAVVLKVLSGVIKTFASAVNVVVGALDHLSHVDLAAINVKVLFELAGVVAAVGAACFIAGPGLIVLAAGIGALAVAIGLLGVGVLAAVIPFGLMALIIKTVTDAIANLATTFDQTGDSLQNGIAGIGTGLADGFINFITVISTNMPKIIKTIGDGLNNGAKEFWAFVENAADILLTGLTNLANKAGEKLPLLSEAISNALYGVLTFIGSRVSDFAVAGGVIAAELFIGITNTLAEYAPEIIEAVYNLGTQLILALSDAWSNHGGEAGDIFTIGILSMIKGTGDFFGMDTSEIQGEIDQQKAELAEKSAEAGKAVGDSFRENAQTSSSNMELGTGQVDTTEAEQTAGNAAKTVTKSFTTNLTKDINFDSVLEKGKALFGDLTTVGGEGATSLIDSFNKGVETEVETIDVSNMNEEFKKQMREEGWEQQGDFMVRTVEKAVNESDVNLDAFNSTVVDNLGDEEVLKAQGKEDKDFYIDGLTDITDEDIAKLRELGARLGYTIHVGTTSEDGLDENSPSKKGIEASEFYVKGLIIGAENLSGKLNDTFAGLASGASYAVASIMGSVSSVLQSNDIDWKPTIAPVLDSSQMGTLNAVLGNNSVFTMAADASLSVNNASQNTLAMQVQNLSDQVQKLASTDYSHMMDGVSINVNADTNVDGTPLRKMSASYTVKTLTDQQIKYTMAQGGRV